jgi:hypothetical protein
VQGCPSQRTSVSPSPCLHPLPTPSPHQFDDASLGAPDNTKLVDIPGALSGFVFDDFRIASCPGAGCKSFPAESTKQFTGPHMGMLEGLVGGLINKELQLKTSPKGVFRLEDANGSFDLGDFDVFDIIDLPVRRFAFFSFFLPRLLLSCSFSLRNVLFFLILTSTHLRSTSF